MSEAKFIIRKEDENKYECNICSEEIEDDKIISLKCNPKKHIYCYDCIFEWYLHIHKKKNRSNYPTLTVCPICRKNGGLLPLYCDIKPIKNIHIINYNIDHNMNQKVSQVNPSKLSHECGMKFKSKDEYCTFIGKDYYGGFCGLHKTIINLTKNNNNKITNKCGLKLKSKDGYCTSSAKSIYGGFCGLHKAKNNENVLVI